MFNGLLIKLEIIVFTLVAFKMCYSVIGPANNGVANRSVLNGGVRARTRPPGSENSEPSQNSVVLPELPTRPGKYVIVRHIAL